MIRHASQTSELFLNKKLSLKLPKDHLLFIFAHLLSKIKKKLTIFGNFVFACKNLKSWNL